MKIANARGWLARLGTAFEGLLSHIGVLLSAQVIVAVLGLGSLAIMTHALGAVGVGILALIETYTRTFDLILRFEPSQAVIRFGNRSLAAGDDEAFRRLIKVATLMDFLGAAVAALIAFAALDFASEWFGFSENEQHLMSLFVLAMFTSVSATSISVLRLTSRFGLYARIVVAVAVVRFLLSGVLFLAGAGLEGFFYLSMASYIAEHLVVFVVAWWILSRHVEGPILSLPLNGTLSENPRLVSYVFNSNMNVVVRNSARHFDLFLLGGIVSHADIGLYQIAKRVGLAAIRLSRPMQFVVFPALSKFWERGDAHRVVSLVLRFGVVFAMVAVVLVPLFVIWGEEFIILAFGQEFVAAQPLLILQIVAASLFMVGAILNSALLSIGRDAALLSVTVAASTVFFVLLIPTVRFYGIIAASWLHVVMNLIWCAGCFYFFFKTAGVKKPGTTGIQD
jgi:O-antigen/teichoic acid export membrane protein